MTASYNKTMNRCRPAVRPAEQTEFTPEHLAKTLGWPLEDVQQIIDTDRHYNPSHPRYLR